jgi:hypothetical protein
MSRTSTGGLAAVSQLLGRSAGPRRCCQRLAANDSLVLVHQVGPTYMSG